MSPFTALSHDLLTSERTLRRAAAQGTLRARWTSPRRAELAPGERSYLLTHWSTLSDLRRRLRTEQDVRLAVLFGSVARGDDGPQSDIDLVVDMRDDGRSRMIALEERLAVGAERGVELLRLSDAHREPLLLTEVLGEGRVIVDRDGQWDGLRGALGRIAARGERDMAYRTSRALARARQLAER